MLCAMPTRPARRLRSMTTHFSEPLALNAAAQLLPKAGATEERTLEAVGCRRLLGAFTYNLQTTLHLDKFEHLNAFFQVFFYACYRNPCVLTMRNQMSVCHDGINCIFTPVFAKKLL